MTNPPGTPRLLRAINDRAALELILEHGPLSRTQLGCLVGLSKPTASQLLSRLKAAGLVVETGRREGSRGPRAQLYAINPRAARVAGVDITAQRIDAAIADITGTVIAEHVLPTPSRSAGGVPGRIRAAVHTAAATADLDELALRQVVIGTPGTINPRTGALDYARHLPGWHSPGLLTALGAELGVPVAVENHVNLAAVAELHEGRATTSENFVLLWASEGLGLAIVIGGELHRGATGGAGEVGYLPLPGAPLPRHVNRGADGGFQLLAGASAVLRLARAHGIRGQQAVDVVSRAAAAAGEPAAAAFLDELATRMATGLAAVTAVLDPELIVLAGDVVLAGGETLRALVEAELHTLTLPRPQLALTCITGNPVRAGAVHTALALARATVFGSTALPPPGSWDSH